MKFFYLNYNFIQISKILEEEEDESRIPVKKSKVNKEATRKKLSLLASSQNNRDRKIKIDSSFYMNCVNSRDEIDYDTYLYTDSYSETPISPTNFEYPPLPRLASPTPFNLSSMSMHASSLESKNLDFSYIKLKERQFFPSSRSFSVENLARGSHFTAKI